MFAVVDMTLLWSAHACLVGGGEGVCLYTNLTSKTLIDAATTAPDVSVVSLLLPRFYELFLKKIVKQLFFIGWDLYSFV